jgi:MFS family permease
MANATLTEETAVLESRATPQSGARLALVLLLGINLFNYIDRQVLAAVVPEIRNHLPPVTLPPWLQQVFGSNPENTLLGLLAMAFMVTYMITAPVFGWLAERVSRWWLIGVGVIVWSLASGASGLAATFGLLLLTRCLVGVGEGAYGPAAPDMISDYYPRQIRGTVLAWFYAAIPVGSALGYVLGGLAIKYLTWNWAFYLVVPPGLVLGLLCYLMREPPRGRSDLGDEAPTRGPRLRDYAVFLRTPSYVLNTLGMTALTFALGGIAFWMPSFIHEVRGEPDLAQINWIFGVIVVVSGLSATLLGGFVADKLRPRCPGSYFLVSGVAMLLAFPLSLAMLEAPFHPFPWAWVFLFLACFCLFFNTGPTNTILANVTHPSMRASGFALNILVIHALGDVISPMVIGAITDASHSMKLAFQVVSGTILVGALLWLWGVRYLERDTERAPLRLSGPE